MEQEIKPKGRGGRKKGKMLPHLHKYPGGLYEVRLAWNRMKAQAKFRKEDWNLDWEQFQTVWQGKWHLRGTIKGSYCLTRKDCQGPWSVDNIEIVSRSQHLAHQRADQLGKKRGPYTPKKPNKSTKNPA